MLILQFETPVTSATGGDLKLSDLIGSESVDTSVEKLTVVEMFGSNGQLKN